MASASWPRSLCVTLGTLEAKSCSDDGSLQRKRVRMLGRTLLGKKTMVPFLFGCRDFMGF